jgi:hypothetical protein
VTITFPGDSNATSLQTFGATVTNNAWWNTIRAGYCEPGTSTCISDGPAGTSVALKTAPAASYTDSAQGGASSLQTYIAGLIAGGEIAQPDAQTILTFYFPASTTVTLDGAASCQVFGGYHNSMTVGGVQFAYAVVDECAPPSSGPKLTLLQETTFASSHEIVEAATDPFQSMNTQTGGLVLGFYLNLNDPNDLSFIPWNNIGGGEAADMCVDFIGLGQDEATEGGFTVQRIWNNAAAATGGDPCVPASTAIYFNAAPEQWLQTVPIGSSATFNAIAFSSAAMADWFVFGGDLNATQTDANPYLTITVNGGKIATVKNGDTITVSVTLNQDPGTIANYATAGGATGLLLSSNTDPSASNPTEAHVWPFLVVSPGSAADAGLVGVDASEDLPRTPHAQVAHAQLAHFAQLFREGRL